MSILKFFKKEQIIQGEIGYLGLSEWWLSEFSDQERNCILETYNPMGVCGRTILVDDEISFTSHSAISLLYNLSSWFKHEKVILSKILSKAESLVNESDNILDTHFLYSGLVQMYYGNREKDPHSLEKAIEMCKLQISIAPLAKVAFIKEYHDNFLPRHIGFQQLAIIEEKRKNFNAAISISRIALEQGWNGDWEKRIERCLKKLNH